MINDVKADYSNWLEQKGCSKSFISYKNFLSQISNWNEIQ